MNPSVKHYLDEINIQYATGYAREHSYRPALQTLLATLLPHYKATNEPARIECGAPDFILSKGDTPMAFVECKDIADGDLDGQRFHKEQFNRYKSSLGNIVFTDYLDFHLYEDGNFVDSVRLAEVKGGKIVAIESNETVFLQLIERLANAQPQKITSSAKLAVIMANKARLLADVIEKSLNADVDGNSELSGQMAAFKQILLHDLNNKSFADIYAQTITYGMFAARLNDDTPEDFSRREAAELIPKTNPFLRKIFQNIAGYDLDDRIAWIVDDLVEAFRATDVEKIMRHYGQDTQQTDPLMHFYEDFLQHYDPATKKSCGVYYTPQPVVNFIVRAVDHILKTDFHLPMGLADTSKIRVDRAIDGTSDKKSKDGKAHQVREYHKVQILDPATGTGTFVAQTIRQIYRNIGEVGMQGIWADYVKEHLIPRLNGFELMMAPYAITHLKLDMLLNSIGGVATTKTTNQRLRIYLTNSLEEYDKETGTLFAQWLASEANEANLVKRDTPVMVMMGNPPYSGESSNKGVWITNLMNDYKREPNSTLPLQERNSKWINDDYCKFIRMGQNYIDNNQEGVLAFINNNGFLDNPTFRGMRWSLLKSFDKIYIINLHGNSKKKEVCPDGTKDENVFDIMVGTSINIFVKTGTKAANEIAEVFYADVMGTRTSKYELLEANAMTTLPFQKVELTQPFYFFSPQNNEGKDEYDKGFSISDLMPVNSAGIVTARDGFTIHETPQAVQDTISDFLSISDEEARAKFALGKDVRDWSVANARQDLVNNPRNIVPILYRPFDKRYTNYTGHSKGFHCMPRGEVMKHLVEEGNIALIVKKGFPTNNVPPIFVANTISDFRYWSCSGMQGGDYSYPLYVYKDTLEGICRIPNLNEEVMKKIRDIVADEVSPEQILDYVYAKLHTPNYLEKNKEFLKVDFPRIPYPTGKEAFERVAAVGTQLRQLHLMETVPSMPNIAQFATSGSNLVEKLVYKDGNVFFNHTQCFSKVPETAWNFFIGGYQPAQKWLKDRKGRNLSFDDILHYRKIIVVLLETDRLMRELDCNRPEH